jgi:hypothetical protein
MSTRKRNASMQEEATSADLVLRLPVVKPAVEVPVVELFLQ